jgi:hypothetical protein
MFRAIVRKELLENILSYRFPLFFLICALLVLTSLVVHNQSYIRQVRDYNEQVRIAGEELAASRMSDLFMGRIPIRGFLPPAPLAVFASGFSGLLPRSYDFLAEGAKYESLLGRPQQDAPSPPPEKTAEYEAFQSEWNSRAQDQKNSQIRDIESSYQREKQRQRKLSASISLLSPSAAFSRLMTDFCGTGEIDRSGYAQSVKDHQRTLDAELYGYVQKQTLIYPSGGSGSSSKITKTVDLKALPAYSFRQSSLSESIAGNPGSLFSLAFWLIAPFAVAYLRFLKYDVR